MKCHDCGSHVLRHLRGQEKEGWILDMYIGGPGPLAKIDCECDLCKQGVDDIREEAIDA